MEEIITNFLSSAPIVVPILALLVSLYTVGKGADILVDNAVSLSLQWGIPKMVLGATLDRIPGFNKIEANPESIQKKFGVFGESTVLGLIIGIAAILGNLPIDAMLVKRQGRLQFIFALLLAVVCLPIFSSNGTGRIYQWMGFIFVFLLCCYMYFSFKWAKESALNASEREQDENEEEKKNATTLKLFLMFLGIAIVVISSKILIPSVAIVATKIGIPQSIIAATIVAFGTSVPELVTAITSVRKGVGELAIGNIVGADILNVLFVLGLSAAVTPRGIPVPTYFYYLQIPSMLLILIVFRFCSTRKSGVIGKKGGVILFSSYVVYLVLNFLMRGIH